MRFRAEVTLAADPVACDPQYAGLESDPPKLHVVPTICEAVRSPLGSGDASGPAQGPKRPRTNKLVAPRQTHRGLRHLSWCRWRHPTRRPRSRHDHRSCPSKYRRISTSNDGSANDCAHQHHCTHTDAARAAMSEIVVPDAVSVAMSELAGTMKEGLLALAVGAGLQGHCCIRRGPCLRVTVVDAPIPCSSGP